MGLSSTIIYTSELILCSTICVPSATRHNIQFISLVSSINIKIVSYPVVLIFMTSNKNTTKHSKGTSFAFTLPNTNYCSCLQLVKCSFVQFPLLTTFKVDSSENQRLQLGNSSKRLPTIFLDRRRGGSTRFPSKSFSQESGPTRFFSNLSHIWFLAELWRPQRPPSGAP